MAAAPGSAQRALQDALNAMDPPQVNPDLEIVPAIAREYQPHIVPEGSNGVIGSDDEDYDEHLARTKEVNNAPTVSLDDFSDSSEEEPEPEREPVRVLPAGSCLLAPGPEGRAACALRPALGWVAAAHPPAFPMP
eukprot:SAG22_NODE_547_length_9252_cov_27.855894_5_plen_135_part_00